MSQRQKLQDFREVLFDVDNVVGIVCDVVGIVDGGKGVNPLRNGPRKSHKKFQLSKLRNVDRRSKLLEGTVCVGWDGFNGTLVSQLHFASKLRRLKEA